MDTERLTRTRKKKDHVALTAYLNPETHALITALAERHETSKNRILGALLEEALERELKGEQ